MKMKRTLVALSVCALALAASTAVPRAEEGFWP